jgi:hypothetical protein
MRGGTLMVCLPTALLCAELASIAHAQTTLSGEPIRVSRAVGPIAVDGDLSDEGWQKATRVEKWYETNPGDNVEPKVRNVGYLAYDDKFLYAGFEFDDPHPEAIRAPYSDRDNVPSYTDYGGVILDARNTGHTALLLLANAHNIQYDSISDDASGEDSSPDFFFETATRITRRGWTLEMRIPFSSLRYRDVDPQTWGIMLYRNYPREFRYQFFSARLPRGGNCFICRSNTLLGLEHLPTGGHIVAAPYLAASETGHPVGDLGTPMVSDPVKAHAGIDVKWTPNADNAIDATIKPDFSQVESDTAQISANQRFALYYPEKRPFFLEGIELFSTPIQAVYTRTITQPTAGARATGKEGGFLYTALVANDVGGGSAIVPGPNDSTLASQDFASRVFVGRIKRDIGHSFVSFLVADREADVNGHNRVLGPDFQWRPTAQDAVTGQWLFSETLTPDRPDLSTSWTGQSLTSHGATVQYSRNTTHLDVFGTYKDIGEGFRADTGFVPQVGYREAYEETGWTIHPSGFLSRLRAFLILDRQIDMRGALISHQISPGAGMDTRMSGFMRFRYENDEVRSGPSTFPRQQFVYIVQFSPSRVISRVSIDGYVGQDVDFDNSRPGRGAVVNLSASLHPTQHLELALIQNEQWLNVDDWAGASRRLFTADVTRLKSTYTFTARSFVRLIGQWVTTRRDPTLYVADVAARDGTLTGSVLFAYKLNWQSVLFVGYGDDRALIDLNRLARSDRQFFIKASYAFQR